MNAKNKKLTQLTQPVEWKNKTLYKYTSKNTHVQLWRRYQVQVEYIAYVMLVCRCGFRWAERRTKWSGYLRAAKRSCDSKYRTDCRNYCPKKTYEEASTSLNLWSEESNDSPFAHVTTESHNHLNSSGRCLKLKHCTCTEEGEMELQRMRGKLHDIMNRPEK